MAVVGSRSRKIANLAEYMPDGTDCIISGGARGIDSCAAEYAKKNGLRLIELLPDYDRYGRRAPLVRNVEIVKKCDFLLAFWDGVSRGTKFTLNEAKKQGKPFRVYVCLKKP